jgi:hypothetical protein
MNHLPNPDDWLCGKRKPSAVYFDDADCVEYVAEDTACVYERVDTFLTLINDETRHIAVGFKLKGFRNWFIRHKDEHGLSDKHFVELVKVLESVCGECGEEEYGDDTRRKLAYQAARKLARGVKLYDLPKAA